MLQMFKDGLKELEKISQWAGCSPDIAQGNGGNTSVKLDDKHMAVKASGLRLGQVTEREGFVIVDYKEIKRRISKLVAENTLDVEKGAAAFLHESMIELFNGKELYPSIETGFHSLMEKYAIHTHSVYANILCCSKEGMELINSIFRGTGINIFYMPYANPGFQLAVQLKKEFAKHGYGTKIPDAVFLENHGLVVSSPYSDGCINLGKEVNSLIRKHFKLDHAYPPIKVKKLDNNLYKSENPYLISYFREHGAGRDFFDKVALSPEQLVYMWGNIGFNGSGEKINIASHKGEIIYRAGYDEAVILEEILTAYLYVVNNISRMRLTLKTMPEGAVNELKDIYCKTQE